MELKYKVYFGVKDFEAFTYQNSSKLHPKKVHMDFKVCATA